MVGRWGTSEAIGQLIVRPPPGQESAQGRNGIAPVTRELVDQGGPQYRR
jgi:hypothetical protein